LIGASIHHYQLRGRDRAQYGEGLFSALAERLESLKVPNCNKNRLYRYRDFFILYPEIVAALSPQFRKLLPRSTAKSSPQKVAATPLSGQEVVNSLSYSHIELLLELDDSLKRAFCEVECIRGIWSMRSSVEFITLKRCWDNVRIARIVSRSHSRPQQKSKQFSEDGECDRHVEGYDPLCGDHYTIYVKLNGDTIKDVSFEGAGCAISKASASVISSIVKGKTKVEVIGMY
jgi:hypothetical protein